ncbi:MULTISPECIES: HAD family hydrolase [Rhodococcus]|uniref:Haloacid dehalogenase n=2 Tax=Rhodococcus opacus TaxID=37919 RepID=A0A076F464_RHOOP|nr:MULTISPECIES: HAD-IB family phosphatase [Rhodococcus]AII10589.1 haloacid dehalogenase [Rhodococcus opacus]QQZ19766.1 HAD-IB family phosphatase [Rhodococcus sp. 21391]
MTKLHVFDMDGTLLQSTASIEISRAVGELAAGELIEQSWFKGEISDVRFWELCLPLWEGLSEADIDDAFAASPWIGGVVEVFADIRNRGEYSTVISQSPQFFVERLTGWGADSAFGAQVALRSEVGPESLLSAEDKVSIVSKLLAEYGLAEGDCVAYGDSTSDIPLFGKLPNTVAVNASARVRELATIEYEGSDLRGAYVLGRGLL